MEHLQQAKQWDHIAKLAGPPIPLEVQYIWEWFWEMAKARGRDGFGPGLLDYAFLKNWSEMTGNRLEPWEVKMLRDLDDTYLDFVADKQKKKVKNGR